MNWLIRAGFLVALGLSAAFAQQPEVVAIRGATVHTLAGDPIANGTVLIRDGKITGVGQRLNIPRGARVIDARGKHVYPGMFDAYSNLGLTEISAVRATNDMAEKGGFNPHLRTATALHPESTHLPVARSNGITHALAAPSSRASAGMTGQAAVIYLDGWTSEEMTLDRSNSLVIRWPALRAPFRFGGGGEEKPFKDIKKEYDEKIEEMVKWLESAEHYAMARSTEPAARFEPNPRLEALIPVVRGWQPVIVVAQRKEQILDAIAFAKKQSLKMILAGGAEAAKVADELADADVPVILGPTQALPPDPGDAYDYVYGQPEVLREAGVRFAFSTFSSANSRTLPYEAASSVAYGLPKEEALKAITKYPAEILGMGDELGTIEEGKIANLIVTNGDPLEIQTAVEQVLINGVAVGTDNKHEELYRKYNSRPME